MRFITTGILLTSLVINSLAGENDRFEVKNLACNSAQSDFGASYYNGDIVFASTRSNNPLVEREWIGNKLSYLNLYVASPSEKGELENLSFLNRKLNKKFHEGPAAFANGGNLMFYTQNYYKVKGLKKLKLVSRSKENGKWSDAIEFPYNNESYSVGHPSLSEDGNTLYFVSDMEGGFGGTDLYKSVRNEDGSWSNPENLGATINTTGNEMFPFYHEDGMLFFSSTEHGSIGGLDVFVSQVSNNTISKPKALESEINSERDDFSFVLSKDQSSGYFTSDREGGKGSDDLYFFNNKKEFTFGAQVKGVVTDKLGKAISNAKVLIKDVDGNVIKEILTNENGVYDVLLDKETSYSILASKKNYFEEVASINTGTNSELEENLVLEKDPGLSLQGFITEASSGNSITNAKVKLTNNITGEEKLLTLTENGKLTMPLLDVRLKDRVSYNLEVEAEGYLKKVITYNKEVEKEGVLLINETVDLALNKVKAGETKLEDLIDIKPIYFDLGKYNIRKDASVELDKVVKVMNENPTMVVELGSHTDSRGSASSNRSLSDKRAKSSAEYIKERISNSERISGKGFGEEQLLNECGDGVKCSEDKHSANRRTEFRILSM